MKVKGLILPMIIAGSLLVGGCANNNNGTVKTVKKEEKIPTKVQEVMNEIDEYVGDSELIDEYGFDYTVNYDTETKTITVDTFIPSNIYSTICYKDNPEGRGDSNTMYEYDTMFDSYDDIANYCYDNYYEESDGGMIHDLVFDVSTDKVVDTILFSEEDCKSYKVNENSFIAYRTRGFDEVEISNTNNLYITYAWTIYKDGTIKENTEMQEKEKEFINEIKEMQMLDKALD